ncbi:hypothetical protein BD777DRAFT_136232 [Yarrowia lipolytica]|nr:hypothetical protein BD777DRAFT_136232 [Yarrowia lipolytica]
MFLDGTWWLYNTQYSRVQYEYSTCTGTITVEKEGIWTGIARTPENQAYYQSYGTNTYILVQLIQKYSIPKGTLIQTTQISLIRVGQGLSNGDFLTTFYTCNSDLGQLGLKLLGSLQPLSEQVFSRNKITFVLKTGSSESIKLPRNPIGPQQHPFHGMFSSRD